MAGSSQIEAELGASEALLVSCRALYRVTASGVAAIATWSEPLQPSFVPRAVLRDTRGFYFVSFGDAVGRFGPTEGAAGAFFAPDACVRRP